MTDYKIAGLALQKAALVDQLRRAKDTFACMLLMGKIKAVQRELDAAAPPHNEKG